jgi:hypothetical protein
MMNPIDLLTKLYWEVFFAESGERLFLARAILWNAMHHLDYEYQNTYRVPSFHQQWAIHKSNITIEPK